MPLVCYARTSDVERNKSDQNPTKVISKLGVSYADRFRFSASFAIDPVRKVNFSIDDELEEWRVGGSWLFRIGIVNFNFGKNVFEHGAKQTNYSIGTFVPLSVFEIEPFGVQIFPTAGYSYNDGEVPCDTEGPDSACYGAKPTVDEHFILVSNESHSGYLGVFALKQITSKWSVMGAAGGSIGSNDYSGYWGGGGAAWQITKRQSLRVMGYILDNSYGTEEKISIGYSYQFN